MLDKSEKFGTVLTIGPRLKKFINAGYGNELLWAERFPGQESDTSDGRGEFQNTRELIETAPLEWIFDLWLRGNNLLRYSEVLLKATADFRRIVR